MMLARSWGGGGGGELTRLGGETTWGEMARGRNDLTPLARSWRDLGVILAGSWRNVGMILV